MGAGTKSASLQDAWITWLMIEEEGGECRTEDRMRKGHDIWETEGGAV